MFSNSPGKQPTHSISPPDEMVQPVRKFSRQRSVKRLDLTDIARLMQDMSVEEMVVYLREDDNFEFQLDGVVVSETERRSAMILLAVKGSHLPLLKAMATPEALLGLGWNLDVKDLHNRTPVGVALEGGLYKLAYKLVTPVTQGGFGLTVSRHAFLLLQKNNPLAIQKDSALQYRRRKHGRQRSFIEWRHPESKTMEIFHPDSVLSNEYANSTVRLFTSQLNPKHKLVVKQPLQAKVHMKSGLHLLAAAKSAADELNFMRKIHDGTAPYAIREYVSPEGDAYDYRSIMSFLEGVALLDCFQSLKDSNHLPYLILAVAKELHRIHLLGIVHRDVKVHNILIVESLAENVSVPSYQVKFVDCEFTTEIGKEVPSYIGTVLPYIAPELYRETETHFASVSHDVYSLAYWVDYFIKASGEDLQANSSLLKFVRDGLSLQPAERPKLDEFIRVLELEIGCHEPTNLASHCRMLK